LLLYKKFTWPDFEGIIVHRYVPGAEGDGREEMERRGEERGREGDSI